MVYRLTQERGSWLFLTPRLENVTDKTKETAPSLIKQIWEFLQDQLEHSEKRELTVGTFVTSANDTTIAEFWREHAKCGLKTTKNTQKFEILEPMLGEDIHGQDILRGKHYLRSIYTRSLEHVNQPVVRLVSGVSQILIQHWSYLQVQ